MHIHGNQMNTQMMGLGASQGTQRAIEANKAAAAVRRKLGLFASAADNDRVEGLAEREPDSSSDSREQPQSEADSFKHFFSITV